jgi:hypothetical protein
VPRIEYIPRRFSEASEEMILRANAICEDYAAQGYDLTLRQLYYQFVSRDWIANKQTEYKRLGSVINDARLAGMLDWKYIVDRTRNLAENTHWETPEQIIKAAADSFMHEKWNDQEDYVEVWIEKDALVGVLESCCPGEDVPFFSCRGYTSQSEIWSAAQRLGRRVGQGKKVTILHLGDHDPSGIDMTRDIRERLSTFIAQDVYGMESGLEAWEYVEELDQCLEVNRIALNADQVRQYNPPPNPAKLTDSRAMGYIANYGRSSWELDALEPTVLVNLIRRNIAEIRDGATWDQSVQREEEAREILTATSERWDEVKGFLA